MEKRERFYNIDFLRFVLAIVIVLYHFTHSGQGSFFLGQYEHLKEVTQLKMITSNGCLAVDFFFIIAGFFLYYKRDFSMKISTFIRSRIFRLYPLVILFSILSILFNIFIYKIPHYLPHEQILRILLIDNIGLNIIHSGMTWFISVLFWCSIFYFYIIKYYNHKHLKLFIPLLITFCYSYLIHANNGNINGHTISYNYVFNAGVMRGLAGLGIGITIAYIFPILKTNIQQIKMPKWIYSLLEIFLLFFVINNICFHKLDYNSNLIIIIGFIFLFLLFLIKKGYITAILNNTNLGLLGKYSFSIYIIHRFVQNLFKYYFVNDNHFNFISHNIYLSTGFVTIICILAGILTYYFVEQPAAKLLNKLWFKNKSESSLCTENIKS